MAICLQSGVGINSISVKKETLITILEIFVLAAVYDYNHNFYDTYGIYTSVVV